MEHPKFVGDRTALAVMMALHEARILFLVPLGETQPGHTRLCGWIRRANNQPHRIRYAADYEIAKVSAVAA
jgi:hypothetical protein